MQSPYIRYKKGVQKTFEYRLYPNREQRRLLLSTLAESRRLYNEMLEVVKAHYDETGKLLYRYELTYRFRGCGGEHVQAAKYILASARTGPSGGNVGGCAERSPRS